MYVSHNDLRGVGVNPNEVGLNGEEFKQIHNGTRYT